MAKKKQATAARTVAALKAAGLTLSCAESCTGGLIAKELTDVPGASAVFHGGVVSYVNAVKRDVLGVGEQTLEEYGAVSPQTARAMAEGARRVLATDLAVSVTGVAGPDRDDRGNEVGTVYIALAAAEGTECVLHRFFGGTRDQIRHAAAEEALAMVLARLPEPAPEKAQPAAVSAYTASDYAALLERLAENRDEKYRAFNESLIPGTEDTYGVRAPVLRALAKELLRGDWRGYLALARDTSHEERLLQGLVIASAKCALPEKLAYLRAFIPRINNWAVCDMVSGTFRWKEEELPAVWEFLTPYLSSPEPYAVRFAVVQLMEYFTGDEWIDRTLNAYRAVRHEDYYVSMALAWALSVCFVHQRDKTLALLKARVFSPEVHNKAIQKCRESRRVSAEDKAYLAGLRV